MAVNQKTIVIVIVAILAVVLATVIFFRFGPGEIAETSEPAGEVEVPPVPQTLAEAEEILGSPEALLVFLQEYFTIEERPGLLAYSPEEFLEKKGGNAHDFAVFAAHILRHNGFESGVLSFNYRIEEHRGRHSVAVFRDKDTPKYLTVADNICQILPAGESFKELVRAEARRLEVTALEYTFFPADFDITDLREPASGRDWIEV